MKNVLDLRTRAERECAAEMYRRARINPSAGFWTECARFVAVAVAFGLAFVAVVLWTI